MKAVITHGAGGFSDEAAIPGIGMQSVSDFDLARHFRTVETTITNNSVFTARDDGKLRRHNWAIPAHLFLLDEVNGLLSFGENA
jgi:hypothetical protein